MFYSVNWKNIERLKLLLDVAPTIDVDIVTNHGWSAVCRTFDVNIVGRSLEKVARWQCDPKTWNVVSTLST